MRAARDASVVSPALVPTSYDVVFDPRGSRGGGVGGGAVATTSTSTSTTILLLPRDYVGNVRFLVDVDIRKERYRVGTDDERRTIVLSMIDTVRRSGGRFLFLRRDPAAATAVADADADGPLLRLLDEGRVREGVSETLREAVRETGRNWRCPPAVVHVNAAAAPTGPAAIRERVLSSTAGRPTADPVAVTKLLAIQMKIREQMERESNIVGVGDDDDDDDDDSVEGGSER